MLKVLPHYTEQIEKLTTNLDSLVFRGQANEKWLLRSAATRRLIGISASDEEPSFVEEYLAYHNDLVYRAKRIVPFGDKDQSSSPLQLLAKLQHFGAATGLVDFTYSPLAALWFACEHTSHDGRVFFLTSELPHTSHVNDDLESADLSYVLTKRDDPNGPDYVIWEPVVEGDASLRILGQRSVFVIGRPTINPRYVQSIVIGRTDKRALRRELAQLDVSESSLYRDLIGFCRRERYDASYQAPATISELLQRGHAAFELGDYFSAIDAYTRCIELGGDPVELRFFRGNAYTEVHMYREAERDYSDAHSSLGESRDEKYRVLVPWFHFIIYFNRGNVWVCLNELQRAERDYTLALSHFNAFSSVYFNLGNVHFRKREFEKAIQRYDEALERDLEQNLSHTLHNKALACVLLGRFDDAESCCLSLQGAKTFESNDLIQVRGLRATLDGLPPSELVIEVEPTIESATISHPDYKGDSKTFLFKGIAGNVGNFGGIANSPSGGSPSGSGFSGGPAVLVRVQNSLLSN